MLMNKKPLGIPCDCDVPVSERDGGKPLMELSSLCVFFWSYRDRRLKHFSMLVFDAFVFAYLKRNYGNTLCNFLVVY